MAQPIMNALDAIAGSQASAYVTMADGNRYCFMQLYSFESKMDISVAEVPILGKSGKGNKPTGWSGTWSGTAHYNQSVFREMLLEYKRTGFMPTFDIQVANEDPTASVGRTASLRAAFWRSLTPTPRLSTRNSRAPSTTGKCPRPLAC